MEPEEFYTESKRAIQDDIVLDIPMSRIFAMNGDAPTGRIRLVNAPGVKEIVQITSVNFFFVIGEIAPIESTPGSFFITMEGSDSALTAEITAANIFNGAPATVSHVEKLEGGAIIANTAIQLRYNGEIEDNNADGSLRVVVSYKVNALP